MSPDTSTEERDVPTGPYGASPYDEFRKLAEEAEDAAGMHWTNNVWQIPPTTADEADECWDEALVAARRVQNAADTLADAVYKRRAAVQRQVWDERDAPAAASSGEGEQG